MSDCKRCGCQKCGTKCHTKCKKSICVGLPLVEEVNVGYPGGNGPVPLTPECLANQRAGSGTIYSNSVVEPSIAVNPCNPKKIVVAWQQGRISSGSALENGIAHSEDGGLTWAQTTVPLSFCTGGQWDKSTDPWLTYSADGKVVYLNSFSSNRTLHNDPLQQRTINVSSSKDNGFTWSEPIILEQSGLLALEESTFANPDMDKNSITADPNHPCYAYSVWDTFPNFDSLHSDTFFSRTTNKGKTWMFPPQLIYNPVPDLIVSGLSNGIYNDAQTINNIILVQPRKKHSSDPRVQGRLICTMVRFYATPDATDDDYLDDSWPWQFSREDVALISSPDKGVTWTPSATIVYPYTEYLDPPTVQEGLVFTGGYTYDIDGNIDGGIGSRLRSGEISQIPAINPTNGNLYYPLQTTTLRQDQLPQIGLKTSRDGGLTWSQTALVSRTPQDAVNPQAFTTSVAVTHNCHVGVLYFDFRNDNRSDLANTLTDAWLAIYKEVADPNGGSTSIGLDFVREVRLSSSSYIIQNGPRAGAGFMTNGDYATVVAQCDNFYSVFVESLPGPFEPSTEILPGTFLDQNNRSAPFVTVTNQPGYCEDTLPYSYISESVDVTVSRLKPLKRVVKKDMDNRLRKRF